MAFIDQSEFEAMKMLSASEAVRCDEHRFHAKIKVSTFKLSLFDKWSEQRRKNTKMALLLPHIFVFSCLLHGFRPIIPYSGFISWEKIFTNFADLS